MNPRPREARMFVQKAARSVSELQPDVSNMADIMMFLEVLGYGSRIAAQNGFEDLFDLAKNVCEYVRFDDVRARVPPSAVLIPTLRRRTVDALGAVFPWVGTWVVFFIFGVSLWLGGRGPLPMTTSFLLGVYLGLVLTEGQMQSFSRLFGFYYSQMNLCEARRVFKRNYLLLTATLITTCFAMYGIGSLAQIPSGLVSISVASLVTLSVHRVSYTIVYAKRKVGQVVLSYSAGLAALLSAYFLLPGYLPDIATRYLVSLGVAFAVLSALPAYHTYRLYHTASSASKNSAPPPNFYNPLHIGETTIRSKFSVQLWETLPHYYLGILSFSMLFGDRIVSWIFSPTHVVDGVTLPLVFNPIYHAGADLALLALLPVTVVQYVLMAPIFEQIHNIAANCEVSEVGRITDFLQDRYKRLLAVSLGIALALAAMLITFAPQFISVMGGSQQSVFVLRVAAASNVLMTAFGVNGVFIAFLNRVKSVVVITGLGVSIIALGGTYLAQFGFQNIVIAYFVSTLAATILSSIVLRRCLRNAASMRFSRFV